MDTTQAKQDKPQTPEDATLKGKETPLVKLGPTPKEEPKTLTIKEAEKLAQLARMDAGRERKEMEVERDSVKSQLTAKESELADVAEEGERLQSQIEDLTGDDPKKFDIIKKDRDLRERERKLKTDTHALEADKQANAGKVKLATDTLREVSIWEISAKYEGGEPVKLKELCDIFGATSDEQIVKVADTLWAKKDKEPETPNLVAFSGRTSGGGGFTPDKDNPLETLIKGFQDTKK